MLITAAICTYNRYEFLDLAVESCRTQTLARDQYKIVVVDGSPSCSARAAFWARNADVEHLAPANPGLSEARNLAVRSCRTPLIAFMDDDAQAEPQWLAGIHESFDQHPGGAAAGGCVKPDLAAPAPNWLHEDLWSYLSVVDWGGDQPRVAAPGERLVGANLAFRTGAVLELGGFDTSIGRSGDAVALLSNEDVDMVARLVRAGHQRLYAPRAVVRHRIGPERLNRPWFRRRVAWQAVSDLIAWPLTVERQLRRAEAVFGAYAERWPPDGPDPADDPAGFKAQLKVIYLQTALLLLGRGLP